jgi:hypothetical protein
MRSLREDEALSRCCFFQPPPSKRRFAAHLRTIKDFLDLTAVHRFLPPLMQLTECSLSTDCVRRAESSVMHQDERAVHDHQHNNEEDMIQERETAPPDERRTAGGDEVV